MVCSEHGGMDNCRIVMVDSGVSNVHKKISQDNIRGVGIEHTKEGYSVSGDIYDWADHGTGIYGILKEHNDKADIFVVRLSDCVNNGNDLEELVYILEFIYNNIVCDLINISISISYCNNMTLLKRLKRLCSMFLEKGILIISAFDNFGGLSYPAVFDSVIGVSSGEECLDINDIEYVTNKMVNICGKGNMQSVISSFGHTIMREGNSLACAHVTGIVSRFYQQGMSQRYVLNELKKRALLIHKVQHNNVKTIKLPIQKRAALITFGKEIHSVVRFSHLLQCEIVKVYDVKQTGRVGKSVDDELNICNISKDYIIENIEKAEFDLFDIVIVGHISQLIKFAEIKKTIEKFLEQCKSSNKYIYSLDDLRYYFNSFTIKDYFTPRVTKEDAIQAPLGKLHYISKPLVGVFGTSSVQGKFTLQLELRERLIEKGYLVGQIGSEPTALLFGMEYCFPFGHNSSVKISRYDTIAYLNKCLYNICNKNVDLILLGCQSRTVQEDNCNLVNYPLQQIEFLLATQPDIVILCVNPWDIEEYILRTINFIESIICSKVIAIAISPVSRMLKDDNSYQYISLGDEESKEISQKITMATGRKVYRISNKEDMDSMCDFLLVNLSE